MYALLLTSFLVTAVQQLYYSYNQIYIFMYRSQIVAFCIFVHTF